MPDLDPAVSLYAQGYEQGYKRPEGMPEAYVTVSGYAFGRGDLFRAVLKQWSAAEGLYMKVEFSEPKTFEDATEEAIGWATSDSLQYLSYKEDNR